jgi:hypothetical protein
VLVVGNESSGKSSVLDRLGMMALLPRGEGTCTRMLINLRMRHSDVPKLPLLLVIDVRSNEVLRRVTLTLIGGEVDVREQMNAIIREEHPQLDSVRLPHRFCGLAMQHVHAPAHTSMRDACAIRASYAQGRLCACATHRATPPPLLRCARPR